MSIISQEKQTIIEQQPPNALFNPMSIGGSASHAVALAAAVLDKRIITARQFPRSIARFKAEAGGLLSEDIETARSAEYSKPVGGGSVRGPSVRLTEIACMCWGNMEVEIQEPMINERSVTVQAFAWDLERNIRLPGIATTSILKADGTRYAPHMVETAVVATAAKARRNAILAVIPRAYINDLLETAKQVAQKHQKPLEEVRQSMLDYFARTYKVESQQVFNYLTVTGVEDIKQEHIEELRAVVEALKEGENPEAYFGKAKSKVDLAREKAAARRAKDEQPPKPEATDDNQASSELDK
jgi:hypothetical protein